MYRIFCFLFLFVMIMQAFRIRDLVLLSRRLHSEITYLRRKLYNESRSEPRNIKVVR